MSELVLTALQLEILSMLSRGYSLAEIAAQKTYSHGYVCQMVATLREEFDTASNTALVLEGVRLGVIRMPGREEIRRVAID